MRVARPMILLLALSASAAEPVAVARLKWEAGLLGSAKPQKILLAAKAPDGVVVPASLQNARFGTADVGAKKKLVFALHSPTSRLWLDAELDGRFDNDRPHTIKKQGQAWNVTPTVKVAGKPLVLYFYLSSTCKHDHVHFYWRMHRRGEVVLAKRVRAVGVADARAGGAAYIDKDGDGRLTELDRIALGKPFALGGGAYTPTLNGDVLEFRKAASAPVAPPTKPPWAAARPAAPPVSRSPGGTLAQLAARFEKERRKTYGARYGTLADIAGLGTRDSFAFLEKVALDGKEQVSVRAQAAFLWGRKAYLPQAPAIVKHLKGSLHASVKARAVLALHFMGYPEREPLFLTMLTSPEPNAVRSAAIGLVLMGQAAPVQAYIKGSAPDSLRAQAYAALRYDKAPPPLDLIRAAARSEFSLLQAYALQDMVTLGIREARAYAEIAARNVKSSITLERVVIDVLSRAADEKAVTMLFSMAGRVKPASRELIRKGLAPVRDPAVTALYLKALKGKEPAGRTLAAALLADLPDRKTTAALVQRAKREKDANALQAVLESLGQHADPRAVAVLLSMAKKRDPVVRAAAIRALAQVGPGIPAVHRFFMKLLASSRWEDRVYALDAAGLAGDPSVTAKIAKNLEHKVWQVRHAAAVALGKLRQRQAIPPMIKALAGEEHKRVRAALAESLFLTTGQNFYDFADTWARWWNQHGAAFKVPEKIPVRKKTDAGTVASFYGLPLDSDRIVFVVDQSGSMSATDPMSGKTRLHTAVSETASAVGRLKPKDRVNVIFFETTIHSWRPKLTPLSGASREALKKYLESRRPTGGTNLYDGLELALKHRDVDTIFLLSDGAPGSGKFTATADILREVGRLNQTRRIAIHCVSVGTESDLLKKLAAANGGRYVRR